MAEFFTFTVRDSKTIRDNFLRTVRNMLIDRGVANPNVTPGSDWFVLGQAVANQLAVTEANATIKADEVMPDTAQGDDLARICAPYGLSKQPAAGSIGSVILSSSQSTTITTGDQLVDGAGLAYEVTIGGIYADGALVPIRAISTGEETNLAAGEIVRWVTTPPFADEKAEVSSGGFVNGINEEDDEVLRARLYDRLQNPPGTGNSGHVAIIAEASTPSVQKAFVYPAIQGGATVHVAVTAAPTLTNKSRDVATATLNSTVIPYIQGQLPEHVHSVITTATNVDADVAFGLVLPESPSANPPGPGGGWLDASPWPAPDASTTFRCTVTSVTSSTVFTVDATTSPTVGVSHVSWLSPTLWQLFEAVVIGVSGTSGAYTITLDRPFTGIATGGYIWPSATNSQLYCDAVVSAFALMGPGEKTSNASALIRGFRRPRPATAWPYSLGGHLTRALTNARDEVEAAQFLHRTDGTTTLTGPGGLVTPAVPVSVTGAPNIFRPRHIAFYRVP